MTDYTDPTRPKQAYTVVLGGQFEGGTQAVAALAHAVAASPEEAILLALSDNEGGPRLYPSFVFAGRLTPEWVPDDDGTRRFHEAAIALRRMELDIDKFDADFHW